MVRVGKILLGLILLSGMLIWILLKSDAVLRLALKQLLPEEVTIREVTGDLSGPIFLSKIHYDGLDTEVRVDQLDLDWRLGRLLSGTLFVERFAVGQVSVHTLAESEPNEPYSGFDFEDFSLPIDVEVASLSLRELTTDPQAEPLLQELGGSAQLTASDLIVQLSSDSSVGQLDVSAEAKIAGRLIHRITARCSCIRLGSVEAHIEGDLDSNQLSIQSANGKLKVNSDFHDLAGEPRWDATVAMAADTVESLPLDAGYDHSRVP